MKNLISRVATALLLLPVAVFALLKGGLLLALLLMVVSLIGCIEAACIIDPKNLTSKLFAGLFWAGIFLPNLAFNDFSRALSSTSIMLLVFNVFVLFSKDLSRESFEKFCTLFFWSFYICFGLASLYWLSASEALSETLGLSFIFFACASTWGNDTFAYFGGRIFGKHFLYPRVSGKKTWEGLLTGSFFSVIVALMLKYLPECFGYQWFDIVSFKDILWISIPAVVFAPLGDLIESRLKRLYDKKDSSQILPGHGGLLDRIDSLLLVMPWTALYAFIIRGL